MTIGHLEIIWHPGKSRDRQIERWLNAALIEHPQWPKIYAIKKHRERYGSDLVEAKEAVETVMGRYPGKWEPKP